MIELDVAGLLSAFALAGLSVVIVTWLLIRLLWLGAALRHRRSRRICRLCHLRYVDPREGETSVCPDCGGVSQAGGLRRF